MAKDLSNSYPLKREVVKWYSTPKMTTKIITWGFSRFPFFWKENQTSLSEYWNYNVSKSMTTWAWSTSHHSCGSLSHKVITLGIWIYTHIYATVESTMEKLTIGWYRPPLHNNSIYTNTTECVLTQSRNQSVRAKLKYLQQMSQNRPENCCCLPASIHVCTHHVTAVQYWKPVITNFQG